VSGGFRDGAGSRRVRRMKSTEMKGHFRRAIPPAARRAGAAGVVLGVVMVVAMTCGAGEIKRDQWPCAFVEKRIPDLKIPVVMDVPKIDSFSISGGSILLKRVSEGTYQGCCTLSVTCTFDLVLDCSIVPTGIVPGDYSCSIDHPEISPPHGTAKVCAEVHNAQTNNLPLSNSVTVANIKVRLTAK